MTRAFPDNGRCNGKDMANIVGAGFLNIPTTRCRWGEFENIGQYVNSTLIRCLTPKTEGDVFVEVSLNGQQYSDPVPYHCSGDSQPTLHPGQRIKAKIH